MARRKSRKASKPRRRNSKAINVVTAAQTYFQTAIITRAAFRTTPLEFFTGQQSLSNQIWKTNPQTGGNYLSGTVTTTGYQPVMNGTAFTLPELLGLNTKAGTEISLGGAGYSGTAMEAIKDNIALNGGIITPIVQTAVLNIGFVAGKALMRKQLGIARKGLKMAGLNGMVKV